MVDGRRIRASQIMEPKKSSVSFSRFAIFAPIICFFFSDTNILDRIPYRPHKNVNYLNRISYKVPFFFSPFVAFSEQSTDRKSINILEQSICNYSLHYNNFQLKIFMGSLEKLTNSGHRHRLLCGIVELSRISCVRAKWKLFRSQHLWLWQRNNLILIIEKTLRANKRLGAHMRRRSYESI